jgi:kynurenine formamidase
MYRWHIHEHTGTHLDAPLHRSDRDSADLIPAAHLLGPLAVVDTLSLDPGLSADFPVHVRWLGSNRWGLECAAHLGELPPKGATLIVGGPKIAGASGGPSRVLALLQ